MTALVILAGVAQGAVGWLGWRGRLRRNRFVGIRTAATMAGEDAFRAGNRVAAPPLLAAAGVAVLGGVAALTAPSTSAYLVLLAVTVLGALGLSVVGGTLGSRAADAAAAAPAFTPCAGCACGSAGVPARTPAEDAAATRGCARIAVTDS